MMMLEFLKAHLGDIVVIIVTIAVMAYLWFAGKKEFLRQVALDLVTEAERDLGSGTGELKYAQVISQLYQFIPLGFRLFITEAMLKSIVEVAVKKLGDYLDNGKLDNSYQLTEPKTGVIEDGKLTEITDK